MEEPVFFPTPGNFRSWLEENHAKEDELWVGYYKKATGIPSITWPESVDQALCFGWIDGIRKRVDEQVYKIRFTPRRKNSSWSQVNLRRFAELEKEGLIRPAGRQAYDRRNLKKEKEYSYENRIRKLSEAYEQEFKAKEKAWAFFQTQAPYYQKTASFWVMSAKREETRQRRLGILIEHSEQGRKIPPLSRNGK